MQSKIFRSVDLNHESISNEFGFFRLYKIGLIRSIWREWGKRLVDRCRDQIAFFSSKFAVLKYMYGNQTLSFYLYVLIQRFLAKRTVTYYGTNPFIKKSIIFIFQWFLVKKNIVLFCSDRAKVPRICWHHISTTNRTENQHFNSRITG